jgi:hypothetical protein
VARNSGWTGWIVFAGWLMIVIGSLDFFEGLIAIVRDKYYVLAPNRAGSRSSSAASTSSLSWASSVALSTRCGRSPCSP